MTANANVLIVGAGPVGMLTALALAQQGIQVTVVEAASDISDAPRAAVYFPSTMLVLKELGIFDDIAANAVKGYRFAHHVPELGEKATLDTGMAGTDLNYNLHCGQHIVTRVAMEHAKRLGVQVLFEHQLVALSQDSQSVTATVKTPRGNEDIKADWLIGTDGARSTTRHLLGLEFEGFTWPNRFVATNSTCDFASLGYEAGNFVCDPIHGAVIAVLDSHGLWRLTYQESAALPVETFMERLPEHFAHFIPAGFPYKLEAASPYTLHQRAATTFRQGRVLLAGDAAHATNPCGGLGLTTGIITGMVLSDVLGAVIQGAEAEAVLDRYSEERRRVFWEITSPVASSIKQRLEQPDLEQRRRDLEMVRLAASDPALGHVLRTAPFKIVGDVLREKSRWLNLNPYRELPKPT